MGRAAPIGGAKNAIMTYFHGVTTNTGDPDLRNRILDHAKRGNYDAAHALTRQYGLIDNKNLYGSYDKFPTNIFIEADTRKHVEEGATMKSIHPAASTIGLNMQSLRHLANENWNKLDKESLLKISNAVAKHGMGNDHGRPLDASDIVEYARMRMKSDIHSPHNQMRRSMALLRVGLRKALEGFNRDPEDQRKQDLNTDFFRKPKTYRGSHPKHTAILAYFDHFSKPLSTDARTTIMHDASIGEYGSAQRKLARRNDGLPAGLDGLKFGDHQIEMIDDMAKEGIFG